ncbi:hypothetical protein, partial [Burkholderia pseudomallei]|uniref:hypothetical protein n=1 Tax=Burkholderia pseudomallei TaxID=28450 RepID=UPI001F3BB2B2
RFITGSSELKNMEAKQKSARIKAFPKARLKSKFASPRSRDPQGRASGQSSSDPIAAFAHDGGGATVPRESHATSAPPHKATVVRKKVKEHISDTHRRAVTSSMV